MQMTREFVARSDRYGRFFDEFEVGDIYKHWPGKTITESEDHLFSLLTMAGSPLHIDSNYAKTEMAEGKNLVVGTYIYALLTGMSVTDISGKAIASLGVKDLQHLLPVFHGDTIYASTEILNKRVSVSKPSQGILTVRTTGTNQTGQIICTFERSVMLPLKRVS
jgi:acyl dehydratase